MGFAALVSALSKLKRPLRRTPKLAIKPTYDYMSTSTSPTSPKSSRSDRKSQATVVLPEAPNPDTDPAGYLRSIYAVRERCQLVMEKARKNSLQHFEVDLSKFKETAAFIISIIKRDFEPNYGKIPPHGRWQHFEVDGVPRIKDLVVGWTGVGITEKTRRIIDLFLVSVLLDAGAGNEWKYTTADGKVFRRSEGLAIASLDMFNAGYFSSNPLQPCQVDSQALKSLTVDILGKGLQVSAENPLAGLEGRTQLLVRLGDAITNATVFGSAQRPGYILDCLMSHPSTLNNHGTFIVPLPVLWDLLMEQLAPIWPAGRTKIGEVSLGDAWPCGSMPASPPAAAWENIVPFHKLTQWLTYSLMMPMTKLMSIQFAGAELMTGLPEYRNGGLLVDMGLLTLKPADKERGLATAAENKSGDEKAAAEGVPMFTPDDDVIVEWRAVTVGFLDDLLTEVNIQLDLYHGDALTLPQMLEAGSWKGGREVAAKKRPATSQPPIAILSDGTVF